MHKRVAIGIDLGATLVKMALVDEKGAISSRRQIHTPINVKKAELINAIVCNINDIICKSGFRKKDIKGVGIGVPGPVDSKRGIIHYFPNIKGWEGVPLKSILQNKLGLKVALDNDVNAMTLGEYKFGAGKGSNNVICLTLGTGVGGGIIINGEIYRGASMCAGEIGHMPINEKGPRCNCRGIGCLERYIGNRYILESAIKIFGSGIKLEDLTVLAKKGNKNAIRIWEDVGLKLGTALTGAINLLNPDKIIIGGGVSKAGGLILNPLRSHIKTHAMKVHAAHVRIVTSALGDNAGIIGASLLV